MSIKEKRYLSSAQLNKLFLQAQAFTAHPWILKDLATRSPILYRVPFCKCVWACVWRLMFCCCELLSSKNLTYSCKEENWIGARGNPPCPLSVDNLWLRSPLSSWTRHVKSRYILFPQMRIRGNITKYLSGYAHRPFKPRTIPQLAGIIRLTIFHDNRFSQSRDSIWFGQF